MLHLAGPKWKPTAAYYDCRFAVLRQPLGFERGAEVLNDDTELFTRTSKSLKKLSQLGEATLFQPAAMARNPTSQDNQVPRPHHFLHLTQTIGRLYKSDKWGRLKHIEEKASQLLSSKHSRRHHINNLAQNAVFYNHVKLPYRSINPKVGSLMSRINTKRSLSPFHDEGFDRITFTNGGCIYV